ncbi:hypothetical protein MTP99_016597 [Tenebrio molitor]|nr:hypothetical protein MTP99_016597 [Tenebrio molitor]
MNIHGDITTNIEELQRISGPNKEEMLQVMITHRAMFKDLTLRNATRTTGILLGLGNLGYFPSKTLSHESLR